MSFNGCWSWFSAVLLQFSTDTIPVKSTQLSFTCLKVKQLSAKSEAGVLTPVCLLNTSSIRVNHEALSQIKGYQSFSAEARKQHY